MLKQLDDLMKARGIGALIIPNHEAQHPSFRWITRGAKVTKGYAVKVAGAEPVLVAYPMEREEAAATGVTTRLVNDFGHAEIFKKAPDAVTGYGEFFDRVLRDLGAEGPVSFFGNAPIDLYLGIATEMQRRGWAIHSSKGEDLVRLARKQKDPWEIDAIRSVGERTEKIVDGVRAMLRECDGGRAMTLGDLKRFVSAEISRQGMLEDHETILSQGRDAGIPHSRGDAEATLRRSVPLILDIFPADKNTGYFFDFTRTFCIGTVPDELRRIHADVLEAFQAAVGRMRPRERASSYQALVCDIFEKKGYATLRSNPTTLEGYVHSLGHGVGLDIHEKPAFALQDANRDLVEPGDILTIEPGLYFPDREIGVRIEDTFLVTDGGVESLCRTAYGLEP